MAGRGNQDLERLCVVWDILIDQERYTDLAVCKDKDQVPVLTGETIKTLLLSKTCSVVSKLKEIESLIGSNPSDLSPTEINGYREIDITIKHQDQGQISIFSSVYYFWLPLCLARNARAILQSLGTTEAEKALDKVAEYLLSRLPDLPPEAGQGDGQMGDQEVAKKFRTLYYNEASQCYLGYLASGYAEKALDLWDRDYTPYELVALYNKALQLSHRENYADRLRAIEYFDEIIGEFKDKELNTYGELGFFEKKIEKCLWEYYVYYPALLNKSETLLKLQRGEECLQLIKKFGEVPVTCGDWMVHFGGFAIPLSRKYKELRAAYLKLCAEVDSSGISMTVEGKGINTTKLREEVSKLLDDETLGHCPNLKRSLELLQIRITLELDEGEADEEIAQALRICEDKIQESNTQADKAEVILLWLKGLNKILSFDHQRINNISYFYTKDTDKTINDKTINKSIISHLSGAVQLFADNKGGSEQNKWLPLRSEIIAQLDKAFAKSDKIGLTGPEIECNEKQFLEALLKGYGRRKPSEAMKLKFNRRIRLLHHPPCDPKENNDDGAFPSDDQLNKVIKFTRNNINSDFYLQRLIANTSSFDECLIFKSHWPQLAGKYAFTILRKWQSFTPSLASYSKDSRGGGYFLCYVDNHGEIEDGIIIDPGYDFLQNFFEHGFSMADVTAVIFTHFHIDHSADFRTMVTLIHEMNKRGRKIKGKDWKERKLQVMVTRSCFEHFYSTFTYSKECIKDVVLLSPGKQEEPSVAGGNFTIQPILAYHQDRGEGDCSGLVVKVKDKQGQKSDELKPLLGMTGDTVWTKTLARDLKACPVVCMNMGALIDVRKDDSFENVFRDRETVKKLIYEQNHLYLPGTLTLLQELLQNRHENGHTKLAVIGELGEELKSGLREDFLHNVNDFLGNTDLFKVLMEDIGLTISWEQGAGKPRVRCARCKRPMDFKEIRLKVTEDERKSEQLNYYCPECLEKIEWLEKGDDEKWRRRYWPQLAR